MDVDLQLLKQQQVLIRGTFSIPASVKTLGIYGPSGAGKTSLLRCLAGLEVNMQGQINWDGAEPQINPPVVGLVFQDGVLYPHLTVAENLAFASRFENANPQVAAIDALVPDVVCNALSIEHLLNKPVSVLSGGEKQRVAIARALLNKPDVLLLDEALSAMDRVLKRRVMGVIAELARQGLLVIMVSHALREIALFCERVLMVRDNTVGKVCEPAELLMQLQDLSVAESSAVDDFNNDYNTIDPLFSVLDVAIQEGHEISDMARFTLGPHHLFSSSYSIFSDNQARVRVDASQVVISLQKPVHSSMLNHLPVRIAAIKKLSSDKVLLQLDINSAGDQQMLHAVLSTFSAHQLDLSIGKDVFASFKAH